MLGSAVVDGGRIVGALRVHYHTLSSHARNQQNSILLHPNKRSCFLLRFRNFDEKFAHISVSVFQIHTNKCFSSSRRNVTKTPTAYPTSRFQGAKTTIYTPRNPHHHATNNTSKCNKVFFNSSVQSSENTQSSTTSEGIPCSFPIPDFLFTKKASVRTDSQDSSLSATSTSVRSSLMICKICEKVRLFQRPMPSIRSAQCKRVRRAAR